MSPPPVTEPGDEPMPDTYWDVTGCGNTVDSTHTQSLRMILDSLRYWVNEMHVDGFRFDLMSALTRTHQVVDMGSHLLTAIGQDPVLRHVKLVAEPWDASMDGYRVGEFPPPWVEWNDQYRDNVRDFWRGHSAGVRTVATRLAGSSDLYADDGRSPYASVNFITAHDGFTLRDLVSYNDKHNEANGEDNRDGTDNNRSWNCGVEGETDDAADHRRTPPAGRQPDGHAVLLQRRADADRRRRARAHPGRQQQPLRPGQRDVLDRLAPDDAWLDVYEITKTALRLRREHPALRQRHWFEGRPDHQGRHQGPAVGPPERSRDVDRRLERRLLPHGRDVPQRRAAAISRTARRADPRQVLHDLAQRRRRRHAHPPRQPVGRPGRGRALDQRRHRGRARR